MDIPINIHDLLSARTVEWERLEFNTLCRRMNIAESPNEAIRPKNVGLMFFCDTPSRFFPQTQIDVIHFPDGPESDIFTEKTFSGPLQTMLGNALEYLRSTVVKEKVVKHPRQAQAERFFNYPFPAIEEALCNAIYHRSYEIREPVEVRILPDHITISSFPGPDRSISENDIHRYRFVSRRYRNRRIGEFLKELEMTEGRGTGIPKMLKACRNNGSPDPVFHTDPDRTNFIVELKSHPGFLETMMEKDAPPTHQEKTSEKMSEKTSEKILLLLKHSPEMTIGNLSKTLGVTTRTIERNIQKLQRDNRLKRIGPDKGGHWEAIGRE